MTRMYWVRFLIFIAVPSLLFTSPGLPRTAHAAASATTIVVNDIGDGSCPSGTVTLRCAIDFANLNPDTHIRFDPSVTTVLLLSPLPTITADLTWLDGRTTSDVYVGPRIDGSLLGSGNGLSINASAVTITFITIINMPAGGRDIAIFGGKDIEVSYDQLGILPDANGCNARMSDDGVYVAGGNTGSAGNDNGTAYIFGNTISCHRHNAVYISNSNYVYIGQGRQGLMLENKIGTTFDGLLAAGNALNGVRALYAHNIIIRNNLIAYSGQDGIELNGTNFDVENNTLSINGRSGLFLTGAMTTTVSSNKIGTSPDGLTPAPNSQNGIFISGGSGNSLSGNLVAYNGQAGIAVVNNFTHATIYGNEIRDNGGLPIDLGNDGATANGTQSPPGPDNWLPYPVATAFSGSFVQGTACPNCYVYIYRAFGNPAAPRGGGAYVMFTQANPQGLWNASLPGGLTRLDVSFIAIDLDGNTSEMSPRPQLLLPLIRR